MLDKLNEAYASLSVMAFARGMHPLVVYHELCRILGQLAIFTPQRRATDIPPYDHEDLGRIFAEVVKRIRVAMRLPEVAFERRYFLARDWECRPRWNPPGFTRIGTGVSE